MVKLFKKRRKKILEKFSEADMIQVAENANAIFNRSINFSKLINLIHYISNNRIRISIFRIQ